MNYGSIRSFPVKNISISQCVCPECKGHNLSHIYQIIKFSDGTIRIQNKTVDELNNNLIYFKCEDCKHEFIDKDRAELEFELETGQFFSLPLNPPVRGMGVYERIEHD